MSGGERLNGGRVGVVLFQLVTLPVEIDASRRAKAVLAQAGIVQTQEEARGVDKVLDAAAMTYVAAALAGVMTLIYLIARANRPLMSMTAVSPFT